MNHLSHQRAIALILLLCALPSITRAAPLADRIPADALLYIGWAGSTPLNDRYSQSNLKQIIDQSALPELLQQAIPQMIQRAAESNPPLAETLQTALSAAGPLWRHPSALYVGPFDPSTTPPTIHLALLCDAGDDAAALSDTWTKLLSNAPPVGPPLLTKRYGNLVVLSLGMIDSQLDATVANPDAPTLATAPGFTAAEQQVQHDAAYVAYVDLAGLVKLGDALTPLIDQQRGDSRYSQIWPQLRDALNLTGLRQAIWTGGFDGKDWTAQAFIGTDGTQRGITAALASQPLDEKLLAVAPQTTARFFAGHLDLAALFKGIRWAIGAIDEESAQQFDQGLAHINLLAGIDLQHDLLESLGDQWAAYSDRTIGGSGVFAGVLVNRLHDPARADAALSELAERTNAILAQQMQQTPLRVQFQTENDGGITVHYLAVPFLSPAWAIANGNLYLSLYPQITGGAARFAASGAPSIITNPRYQAVLHRLADHPPAAVTFLDLPTTAPESYSDVLAMTQLYLGFAQMAGGATSTAVLPPLDKILPILSPAASVSWSDSIGWHSRSISPFPGAEIFGASGSGSSMMIGQSAMMISVLLPSLNRARETANRVKCAANERQIGQAILLYSNDHQGQYPPDLGTLIFNEPIGPEVFVCPSAPTQLPPNLATMTPQQKADWINHNSDYIYAGQGLTNQAPPDRVVLYEKPDAHAHDGMNILFGDGHVAFYRMADAQQMIKNNTGAAPPP